MNASQRQKRPAKYRNQQNPEETSTGIGRSPKLETAILNDQGIDMSALKSIPMYRNKGIM